MAKQDPVEELRSRVIDYVNNVSYSQQEIAQGKPFEDFQAIEDLQRKLKIRLDPSTAKLVENAKTLYLSAKNPDLSTNFSDQFRYTNPNTRVGARLLQPGYTGQVKFSDPKTATMNVDHVGLMDNRQLQEILAHEYSHSDAIQKFGEGAKDAVRAPQVIQNIVSALSKPAFAQRITPGSVNSNSLDNAEESRATLVQLLATAPKGTQLSDIIATPLGIHMKANDGKAYTWTSGDSKVGEGKKLAHTDPATVTKIIEQDMFPRERWIEQRAPTLKESALDALDKVRAIIFPASSSK